MTEPRLQPLGPLRLYVRQGVVCRRCRRVFRNEQGLAGHRFLKHGGARHA